MHSEQDGIIETTKKNKFKNSLNLTNKSVTLYMLISEGHIFSWIP